jgi:DNA excision repair protein ERCC-4
MLRHYRHAALLIEFSGDKPFSLLDAGLIPSDVQLGSVTSKLCLLVLAFPKLKILWSRNPVATTSIFKELKRNFDDVDLARALAAGTATDAALGEDEGGGEGGDRGPSGGRGMPPEEAVKAATDMLRKLPGVDAGNARRVLGAIGCLADLADMAEEQLVPLVGVLNARKLFSFLKCPFPS